MPRLKPSDADRSAWILLDQLEFALVMGCAEALFGRPMTTDDASAEMLTHLEPVVNAGGSDFASLIANAVGIAVETRGALARPAWEVAREAVALTKVRLFKRCPLTRKQLEVYHREQFVVLGRRASIPTEAIAKQLECEPEYVRQVVRRIEKKTGFAVPRGIHGTPKKKPEKSGT